MHTQLKVIFPSVEITSVINEQRRNLFQVISSLFLGAQNEFRKNYLKI
jgi:hypothetical protein